MKKIILLLSIFVLVSCTDESLNIIDTPISKVKDPNADYNELRNAYFGDTHVHTKHSFDAYLFGTTVLPLMLTDTREAKQLNTQPVLI